MRAIRVISAAFAIIAAGLTGAAFASGYWTGTIADIVVSDPEDGSGTALPDVFCGRSGVVYAAWQQEVMTESGILSSEIAVSRTNDVPGQSARYPMSIISNGDSYNPECEDCTVDVVVGPDGKYFAVWNHFKYYGDDKYKRVYFGMSSQGEPSKYWTSMAEDKIISNESVEGDALCPRIALSERGDIYATWAQVHSDDSMTIEKCLLFPSMYPYEDWIVYFDKVRKVRSPEYFHELDIAYENGEVCIGWIDMNVAGITEFWSSFSHNDFLEYDTYVAFTAGEHEAMHGLTIAVVPPAEPLEGGFGNKRGAGAEDETAIFHVIYGRENLNCRHSLYHRTATVEEETIEWSSAEELINNLHHTDGDLDPAMVIDTEERMHVAWRGKFEGMNHRECYYTFSTDGGSSWGTKAGTYEMISFDDEYTDFGVKSPAITLDDHGNPCVAWKEIANAPPLHEIHNSKLHSD